MTAWCSNLVGSICVFVLKIVAAAKRNSTTKDISKKLLEDELANWFGNARDRGEGGRKGASAGRVEQDQQ